MAKTTVATLQTAWDCRWSRPDYHVATSPAIKRLESAWACLRDGQRQTIDPADCETCSFWQQEDHPAWTSADTSVAARDVVTPLLAASRPPRWADRMLYLGSWMLLLASAGPSFSSASQS